MTQPFTPTPDMLAILAEVEANPRSKFLKLPLRLGNPGAYSETLTGSETFLTSAEKKLVRSYREELVAWLYYRAMGLMADEPVAKAELFDTEQMMRRSERAVHPSRNAEGLRRGWSQHGVGEFPRLECPISCLQGSLRLMDKAAIPSLLALAEIQAGRHSRALAHLEIVMQGTAGPNLKSKTASNLGLLYWRTREYGSASKAYAWAANLNPGNVRATMFALISAGFSDNSAAVTHHAEALEGIGLEPNSREILDIVQFCRLGASDVPRHPNLLEFQTTSMSTQALEVAKTLLSPYLPPQ